MMRTLCTTALLTSVLAAPGAIRAADEPLHVRIDKAIVDAAKGSVAPRSSDAEFVRRVYLDFAGRIPTSDETR